MLVAAILEDHAKAPISAAERVMLDFAVALTLTPGAMTRAHVQQLRAAGFDDREISQIVQITALFNYYNRIADGLGIEPEPEWGGERPDHSGSAP
jgi:uncharacterized peroxidase-related enzyme